MDIFRVKQGDAYAIPVTIKVNGTALTDTEELETVEFMLGRYVRKTWPEDVTFSEGEFAFPLTQKETFALKAGEELPLDLRVKFVGDDVIGTVTPAKVMIVDAQSTEEL